MASPRCFRFSACSIRRRKAATGFTPSRCKPFACDRTRIRNREIGFIFQAFNLIGDLTVFENVELPLTYRSMARGRTQENASRKCSSVWAWRTGRNTIRRSFPAASSSASRWRARLAGQPSILLADEPTGNLDSKNSEAVIELLRQLHGEGATICMVTHDPRYAGIADRTVHLMDGRIVAEEEVGVRDPRVY